MATTAERFVDKTRPGENDCVLWMGARNPAGYGRFGEAAGRVWLAHRYAWTLRFGPIPAGLCVLHRCDNPPCVNVDHLFLGTYRDNARDAMLKGRKASQKGEDHSRGKLTEEDVREIRRRKAAGEKNGSIAAEFGITKPTVVNIAARRLWPHITEVALHV